MKRLPVALLGAFLFAICLAQMPGRASAAPPAPPKAAVVVVLPPLAQFPEFAEGQDPVEEELTGLLVGGGYKVRRLVRAEFIAALKEEIAAVGGIYDPLTGEYSAARYEEAVGRLTRRIVEENENAVVLSPRLVLRTATVRGDAAEWDDQVRMGRTTHAIDQTVVWTGTTKGVSVELTGFAPSGERLFKTYGGLVLPYRTNMEQSKMELRRNIFSLRSEIVDGSRVALKPLLSDDRQ
jgi:hypothetical protein